MKGKKLLSLALGASLMLGAAIVAKPSNVRTNAADGTTVTWTATSGGLGSGIGTGTFKTGTFEWSYERTLVSGASYTGWTSNCIQLGKNGGVENAVFRTSNIPGTISSVSIECSSYNNAHKASIMVNNTTYLAATATAKWTTVSTLTGTGNQSGEIVISLIDGTRALYVKSISVTYVNSSTPSVAIEGAEQEISTAKGVGVDLSATVANAAGAVVNWSCEDTNGSLSQATGNTTTFTSTVSGKYVVKASITVGEKTYTSSIIINVLYDEPEIINAASLKEVLDSTYSAGERIFTTSGIIKEWKDGNNSSTSPTKYGGMVIADSTAEAFVYGSGSNTSSANKITWNGVTQNYEFVNGQNFLSIALTKNLKIGDKVYMECIRTDFKGTKEISGLITRVETDDLQSIAVTPTKTEYILGEEIAASDFTVMGSYLLSGNKSIASADCSIEPNGKLLTAGTVDVTISYGGKSDTYQITVTAAKASTLFNDYDTIASLGVSYKNVKTGNQNEFNKVTNANDLKDGDLITIACSSKNATVGNISSQIFTVISSTFSDDKESLTPGEGTVSFVLKKNETHWNLVNADTKELLGATAVKKLAWDSGTTTWDISIDDKGATISNTNSSFGRFLYNQNNTNPRFLNYASTTSTSESMILPEIYKSSYQESIVYNHAMLQFGVQIETELFNNLNSEAQSSIEFGMLYGVATDFENGDSTIVVGMLNDEQDLSSTIDSIAALGCRHKVCTPVRVDEDGNADASGAYYQWGVAITNIPAAGFNTALNAVAYVCIDGVYYINEERGAESVTTLADKYVKATDTSKYADYLDMLKDLSTFVAPAQAE